MAEGFESYHVPQQSRRDKLRIVAQNHNPIDPLHGFAGFFPMYDAPPAIPSSDLLSCAANSAAHEFHQSQNHSPREGVNFMSFFGGISSSSSSNQPYSDPNANPNPYFVVPEHSYNSSGSEFVVFKPDSSPGGQGLSLSLSSQQHNLLLELNSQRYGCGYVVPGIVGGGSASTSYQASRCSVPFGPFTGYASILKGSRFLKPTQILLEELCDVGGEIRTEKFAPDSSLIDPPSVENLNDFRGGDGSEIKRKKSRLLSMLDEVYRRYKLYFQQMQAVVASFESVAGLGNAAPYAHLAVKAMSKHFTCLKNSITDQLQFTNKTHDQISPQKDNEMRRTGDNAELERGLYSLIPAHNSGHAENHPVWRPQRGLPERAVTVLRAWLFEHFLHPYPTDTDKMMLAKQTGLSRSQVSNWFINARVRLWKPMVEEIHTLETRQAQNASQKEERNGNKSSDHSLASEDPYTSTPSKRSRSEFPDIATGSEPLNLSYNNLSSHPHVGVSMAGGSSGVSLTLGLHQDNRNVLSESFPMNAAQRFGLGLEVSSEGYGMGGYESSNRHFGRDVMGGQLLHDFVG